MVLMRPALLLLLLLVLAGAAVGHRLRPGPGIWTRAALLSLLVLTLTQPMLRLTDTPATVVYLLDQSDSIPVPERERAAQDAVDRRSRLPANTTSHTLSFGSTVWAGDGEGPGGHTVLAAAMEGALQAIPVDHSGEVVVYTDGRSSGDALQSVLDEARARGVSVQAVPLTPAVHPGPGRLLVEQAAAPGETVSAQVLLHGGPAGHSGELVVRHGEQVLLQEPLSVEAGAREERAVAVPLPPDLETGLTALTATFADHEVTGHVLISRPPAILLVGDRRGDVAPLEALLTSEGMQVDRRTPRAVPARLDGFDVVVLADTPTRRPAEGGQPLPPEFVSALGPFVRAGGGLLVLGGERAYDLGGWEDSPLETLLPVRLDPDGALKDDAVTLVIAMDKSGSMARPATPVAYATGLGTTVSSQLSGGRPVGSKIRLADEGAIATLELLREKDRLGVLTIDSVARWVVPIQLLSDRERVKARILQIGAGGGGINLMTALEATYSSLEGVDTPIRHAILFADSAGISERRRGDQTAMALVERYRSAEITLSIVGIGGPTSRDTAYLTELAARGGGQMYLTDDARKLPALFTQETERLMGSSLQEEPSTRAQQLQWHPALRDVDVRGAPALRGFNTVLPRERARLLLTTSDGAPLLAIWRVGLGEVAASATDAGARWAGRWLRWDGYARLWTQMVRHLAAPEQSEAAILSFSADGPEATAKLVMRRPDGLSVEDSRLTFRLNSGDSPPQEVAATVPEPGTWSLAWDSPPNTLWTLSVTDPDGQAVAASSWVSPPSHEPLWQRTAPAVLEQLTAPSAPAARSSRAVDLSPWLLCLVALLLPIDAFARSRKKSRRR